MEALLTSILLVVAAEMGDKTQLAAIALAARLDSLALVVIGTTTGIMIASVPAVLPGERLTLTIPMKAVRIVVCVLVIAFGALGQWTAHVPIS